MMASIEAGIVSAKDVQGFIGHVGFRANTSSLRCLKIIDFLIICWR